VHDVDDKRGGRTTVCSPRCLTTTDNATLTRAGCRGFCAVFGIDFLLHITAELKSAVLHF
jgi:hypothetical protein